MSLKFSFANFLHVFAVFKVITIFIQNYELLRVFKKNIYINRIIRSRVTNF